MLNKIQKKSHLRSLTSHKLMQPKSQAQTMSHQTHLARKEDGQREDLTYQLAQGSPAMGGGYQKAGQQQSNFTTIDQNNEESSETNLTNNTGATRKNQDRTPVHMREKQRDRDDSLRASITREVTTAKQIG